MKENTNRPRDDKDRRAADNFKRLMRNAMRKGLYPRVRTTCAPFWMLMNALITPSETSDLFDAISLRKRVGLYCAENYHSGKRREAAYEMVRLSGPNCNLHTTAKELESLFGFVANLKSKGSHLACRVGRDD